MSDEPKVDSVETRIGQPIPDWRPSTPPVTSATIDDVLHSQSCVVVHFWAVWNGHDPLMDRVIQEVRPRLAHRIHFVSCDIDADVELSRRCEVANVPFLAVFVDGTRQRPVIGLRTPDGLAAELETRLAKLKRSAS
jgi:thioredoxin-like negative regulator of GroEL